MCQCPAALLLLSNGSEQQRVLANIGENTMTNWSGNLTMLVLSVASQKGIETALCQRTTGTDCKPVEQEENHEKGPLGSWAANHMGNPR